MYTHTVCRVIAKKKGCFGSRVYAPIPRLWGHPGWGRRAPPKQPHVNDKEEDQANDAADGVECQPVDEGGAAHGGEEAPRLREPVVHACQL